MSIYESGTGKIKLRGKVDVEEMKGGKKRLVISEIPYTMIGAGIGTCFTALPFGVLLVGIGLLLFALALVGLVFLKWAATCALPAILRNFTDFCCRIVNRGRKEGERA